MISLIAKNIFLIHWKKNLITAALCRKIAAHPNVRLFITHDGLFEIQEAISSGFQRLIANQELHIENYVAEGTTISRKQKEHIF